MVGEGGDNKRHPLFENNENAKFFIMKSPNMECLMRALKFNEWAISDKAAHKLLEAFNSSKNVILLHSVVKSNTY